MKLSEKLLGSWEFVGQERTMNWAAVCILSFVFSVATATKQTPTSVSYFFAMILFCCSIGAGYLESLRIRQIRAEHAKEKECAENRKIHAFCITQTIALYRDTVIDDFMSRQGDGENTTSVESDLIELYAKSDAKMRASVFAQIYDVIGRPYRHADSDISKRLSASLQEKAYALTDKLKQI